LRKREQKIQRQQEHEEQQDQQDQQQQPQQQKNCFNSYATDNENSDANIIGISFSESNRYGRGDLASHANCQTEEHCGLEVGNRIDSHSLVHAKKKEKERNKSAMVTLHNTLADSTWPDIRDPARITPIAGADETRASILGRNPTLFAVRPTGLVVEDVRGDFTKCRGWNSGSRSILGSGSSALAIRATEPQTRTRQLQMPPTSSVPNMFHIVTRPRTTGSSMHDCCIRPFGAHTVASQCSVPGLELTSIQKPLMDPFGSRESSEDCPRRRV